jgi:hypothetical protein
MQSARALELLSVVIIFDNTDAYFNQTINALLSVNTLPKFVTFNLLDTIFTKLAELTVEHGMSLLSK